MLRRTVIPALLLLCAVQLQAQVEARQAQKVEVAVSLLSGDREIRSWKDQLVLGMSAGDIIGGGALGAANPDKAESPEIVWAFDSEEQMREQIGSPDSKLRIVVGIVD